MILLVLLAEQFRAECKIIKREQKIEHPA
jgi:hypothetical protein